jgi:hypothetical protein
MFTFLKKAMKNTRNKKNQFAYNRVAPTEILKELKIQR